MKKLYFTAGRLMCRQIREYLQQECFGTSTQFLESSGWIVRDFVVAGEDEHIEKISLKISDWYQHMIKKV